MIINHLNKPEYRKKLCFVTTSTLCCKFVTIIKRNNIGSFQKRMKKKICECHRTKKDKLSEDYKVKFVSEKIMKWV